MTSAARSLRLVSAVALDSEGFILGGALPALLTPESLEAMLRGGSAERPGPVIPGL